MEDKTLDLPDGDVIPRIPPKTYRWEDIRRQKLEGSYPWTHLYKPPFDPETWEREKSLEYEPVGLMERHSVTVKSTIVPPMVKITDVDVHESVDRAANDDVFRSIDGADGDRKSHLKIPNDEELDDSESDDADDGDDEDDDEDLNSEQLTAHDLQSRIEERFFCETPTGSSAVTAPKNRSRREPESEPLDDRANRSDDKQRHGQSAREKTRSQINRIKEKFEHFREQQSKRDKDRSGTSSADRFRNKVKFRMRKPNIDKMHLPSLSSLRPNISFPNLHFSLSRSNSVKSLQQPELGCDPDPPQPKRKFDFGTYPRIFKRKKPPITEDDYYEQVNAPPSLKSAPSTPPSAHKKPFAFGQKLLNRFRDKSRSPDKDVTPVVVHSSIVVDTKKPAVAVTASDDRAGENRSASETNRDDDFEPTEMIIDNKNFFFISLHEDRADLAKPPTPSHAAPEESLGEKEAEAGKRPSKKFNFGKKDSLWSFALKNKEQLKKESEIVESSEDGRDTANEAGDGENGPSVADESIGSQESLVLSLKVKSNADLTSADREPEEDFPGELAREYGKVRVEEAPKPEPRTKRRNRLQSLENISFKDSLEGSTIDVHRLEDEDDENGRFEEYESALEKSKLSSDYYSALELNAKGARSGAVYSSENALVRLDFGERPRSPVPPKRTRSLYRNKQASRRVAPKATPDNEPQYHTLPLLPKRPDRPQRRLKKIRKHSTSSTVDSTVDNQTRICSINDVDVNRNIANSKQLSISFLPLSDNNVLDDDVSCYDLRETSSMIHLNIPEPVPIPPRRKKITNKSDKGSTGSLIPSADNNNRVGASDVLNGNIREYEFEYVDDGTKTPDGSMPPARPIRRRSASTMMLAKRNEDVARAPSPLSSPNDLNCSLNDLRNSEAGYAVVGKPPLVGGRSSLQQNEMNRPKRSSSNASERETSTLRQKIRRISDFFTLPRTRKKDNYVFDDEPLEDPTASANIPSRPPRKCRPADEHLYAEDNLSDEDVIGRRHSRSECNLKKTESLPCGIEDNKYLQSGDILERMKSRPLPPPPRPARKMKDDDGERSKTLDATYSRCNKRGNIDNDDSGRDDNISRRKKEDYNGSRSMINFLTENKEKSVERKIINIGYRTVSESGRAIGKYVANNEDSSVGVQTDDNDRIKLNEIKSLNVSELNVAKLNVSEIESSKLVTCSSELNVGKLNVSEIESSRLVASDVTWQVSDGDVTESVAVENDDVLFNESVSAQRSAVPVDDTDSLDGRSRISSMVPEVGSDDEQSTAAAIRPIRKKNLLVKRTNVATNTYSENRPPSSDPEKNQTLTELTQQILQICQSNVGQAIHSMVEQFVPENREKRNELQTAIWIITIIVAGCLVLGLGSEKQVHHHHWDFHFPPPH